MDHYWFEIRVTKASSLRWHTDVNFFSRKSKQFKFGTTLLGPGTLFLVNGSEGRSIEKHQQDLIREEIDRDIIDEDKKDKARWERSKELQEILVKMFEGWAVMQTGSGEVVRFRVGDGESAVHSEPDNSTKDRIFVSILPGTEGELKKMADRWGMPWSQALG
jgi:hypothetical protein